VHLYDVDDDSVSSSVTALQQDPIRPEAALESILHANPQLIADEPLLIIGRQVRLDSGVADLLACDRHGNVVVVEVKIGRSGTGSASEETILSQPQTYAGSLSNFEFDV
jgi:RecB family endonuclease NucS